MGSLKDISESDLRFSLEAYVNYALPRSKIVSSAGGALTIAINKLERNRLVAFLRALKKDDVMDWSIGNSTLEEVNDLFSICPQGHATASTQIFQVFLKLCAENKNVVTDAEGQSEKQTQICRICASRPTDPVELFTKSGKRIELSDVVCKVCADGINEHDGNASDDTSAGVDSSIVSFSEFMKRMPISANEILAYLGQKDSISIKQMDQVQQDPSIAGQLKAVMMKNMFLHSKERRMNWCFVVFLVILTAIGIAGLLTYC